MSATRRSRGSFNGSFGHGTALPPLLTPGDLAAFHASVRRPKRHRMRGLMQRLSQYYRRSSVMRPTQPRLA